MKLSSLGIFYKTKMATKMAFAKEILLYSYLVMLEKHVIHQNRGFGCSIEIFRFDNCIIAIFLVIGHVMLFIYILYVYRYSQVANTIVHVVDLSFLCLHIHI